MRSYMSKPANFGLGKDAALAGAAALGGGALWGGGSLLGRKMLGDKLTGEDVKRDMVTNTMGGVASGLGGFLLTKALTKGKG